MAQDTKDGFKSRANAKRDQLCGSDFHAFLDNTEADRLQITKK